MGPEVGKRTICRGSREPGFNVIKRNTKKNRILFFVLK